MVQWSASLWSNKELLGITTAVLLPAAQQPLDWVLPEEQKPHWLELPKELLSAALSKLSRADLKAAGQCCSVFRAARPPLCARLPRHIEVLSLHDATWLGQLETLRTLKLRDIQTAYSVALLPRLTCVELSGDILDLAPLRELPQLRHFTLTLHSLSDREQCFHLHGLDFLTQIVSLRLYQCRGLQDINSVSSLTQLTAFSFIDSGLRENSGDEVFLLPLSNLHRLSR